MPKGPKGEKRPADVVGNAVKVMRIATGEETEELGGAKSRLGKLKLLNMVVHLIHRSAV